MTKQGSVAPKERVNIVYKPATGDAREEKELPFKLVVMGDFTHSDDERMVEDRDPVSIDKDNFDDVLKAQNLRLKISVKDKLPSQKDDELGVDLAFETMADFSPDRIVRQVPQLRKLLQLRESLKALKSPLSNIPEFRKKIQAQIQDLDIREKLLEELGVGDGDD